MMIDSAPGAPLVPPSLMVPPFANDRRGILHDEAAALLNRHLRRLARMRNPVELRIARLLGRMKRLSGYLDLGFARMTDYAVERLGLSARRAQVLMQVDDGLRRLPVTARAYEAGRLSHSQVLLLLRIATPETESLWLQKAATMNVRNLEKDVRRARAALEHERAGTPSPATTASTTPPAAISPATTASTTPPAFAASTIDTSPLNEDNDETQVPVSFPAPDWVRGQWDWAVEVFRRTAGAAAPIWHAAEGFAAEYLSGLPQLPPDVIGMADDPRAAAPTDAHAAALAPTPTDDSECGATIATDANAAGAASPNGTGLELFEEMQRALEDEFGIPKWAPSADDMEVTLPSGLDDTDSDDETPGDVASLDHRLRGLIDIRQNLAWHQGRLLRTFANYRLYRALGFESFSRYCRENLGMSVRRARRLIALERRLIELPDLERAYRTGELSWVKASEIARVAMPETEKTWIHLGRSVTVRRLREEAALALTDMENDAPTQDARRGLPRGLTPDGQVQLSAPSPQPPPDPGCTPSAASAEAPSPAAAQSPAANPAVQMSAPVAPGVQTSARSNRITTRIYFRAPEDVAQLWRQTLAACRAVNGDHLQDWECVAQMLESFRRTWDLRGSAAWRRRYRIFERDGWRCRVPGCTSRRNLHGHHVVFRSSGGGDEDDNLVTVCVTHHLRCLHTGSLRCHRLPDGLLAWEFGAAPGVASGVASGFSFGGPPGTMNSTDPTQPHHTDTPTAAIQRFVEDVVWETARDAVRSRDDSSAVDHQGATRPYDRLNAKSYLAAQA